MKTNPATNGLSLENNIPRFIALGLLAALLLCSLARGEEQKKLAVNPTGVYTLVSVGGKAVPCTLNHEDTAMEVQSGAFTIGTNGQCSSLMVVSVGEQKNLRIERRASYTLAGPELTMQWQGAGMTKGQVAGRTFTMGNEGMVFVYRK